MINLDRLAEIEKVAEEALSLSSSAREAFIASACRDDAELQTAVEAIVSASSTPTTSFETASSLGLSPREEIKLKAGDTVAHFVIRKPLEVGGMGSVYVAHDTVIDDRDVALKILSTRLSQVSRDKLGARFDTDYIPTVYEIGETADGLTYIAMELVDGVPITTFCEGLSLKIRLKLFRDVCAGVAVIHAEPMVHRDLKPDNILVTKKGVPKILDFGTARLLSADESLTLDPQPNDRFLSPEFASPEQIARTGLSPATDIYSLGVLFCLLLAGRLPYRIKTRASLPWAIANLEPERPSVLALAAADDDFYPLDLPRCSPPPIRPKSLAKSLSGDLDAIAIKCLQKEPRDRYLTVQDLSKDIDNYFEPRPVSARRSTVRDALSKAVRRNLLAIAVISGLLLFIAILVSQVREARYQRDAAKTQATRAEKVSHFLIDLFKLSDPTRRPGSVVTARELLDKAAKDLPGTLKNQPEAVVPLLNTLGQVYGNLNLFAESERCYRSAMHIAETHLSHESLLYTDCLFFTGNLESSLGHQENAALLIKKSLGIRRKKLPPNDPRIVGSLHTLGTIAYYQRRFALAENYLREALRLLKTQAEPELEALVLVLNSLGVVLSEQAQYPEAEVYLRESLNISKKLYGLEHPFVATKLNNLAILLEEQGRLAESASLKRQALEIDKKTLGNEHANVAVSLSNLGFLLYRIGDLRQSVIFFGQAAQVATKTLGTDDGATITIETHLAHSLKANGRVEEADDLIRKVLDKARRKFGERDDSVGRALKVQGEVLCEKDEFVAAAERFEQAIYIFNKEEPKEDYGVLTTRAEAGSCLVRQKRFAEAEPLLLEYLDSAKEGDKPDGTARLYALYTAWGRGDKAATYKKILEERFPLWLGSQALGDADI